MPCVDRATLVQICWSAVPAGSVFCRRVPLLLTHVEC